MKTAKELKAQATETFNDIFGLSYEKPSDIRDYLLYKIFSFNHEAKQELSVNGRSKDFWVAVEKWSFIYSESLVKEVKEEIKTCHFPNISDAIKYVTSFGAVLTGSISSNERSQYEYSINGTVVLICKEHGEPDYWVHVKDKDKDKEEANKITFDEVKTFALSCGYNLITEEEYAQNSGYNLITERKNENNFRLSTISGKGQFVQLTDVIKTIREGTLLNKEFTPLPFPMTEDEVREFALSCGYANFYGWHGGYILGKEGKDRYSYTLADVVDVINEGRLLSGEACAWPINSNSHPHNSLNNPLPSPSAIANLNLNNEGEEIKEVRIRKVNLKVLKVDGKMVAVNTDVHNEIKLTHDPIFGWQLVGVDSQVLREPLNSQTKEQPTLKFKTRESANLFAGKLMAKIKNIRV